MPIPIGLAIGALAAGTVINHKAEQDAADRRRRLQQAMEAYQMIQAGKSRAASEKVIETQTPDRRAADMAAAEAARSDDLNSTVDRVKVFDASPIAGNVSTDYREAQAAAAERVAERTRRAIEQMATIGAPEEVGLQHRLRLGRASGEVDAANKASANVGNAYLQEINNTLPDWRRKLMGNTFLAVGSSGLGGSLGRSSPSGGGSQ